MLNLAVLKGLITTKKSGNTQALTIAYQRVAIGIIVTSLFFLNAAANQLVIVCSAYTLIYATMAVAIKTKLIQSKLLCFTVIPIDCAIGFWIMASSPEASTFVFAFLLWMILGTGFRLGVKWLFVASIVSLLAFVIPMTLNQYWNDKFGLSAGLAFGLLAIPSYCSTLMNKLSDAKHHAEAASKAKSYFLTSISHELRTPLNAIIGYGSHLKQMELPVHQLDMVEASVNAGEHLLKLVDQLMQVAYDGAETGNIAPKPMQIPSTLVDIRNLMNSKAQDKNLVIRVHATPECDKEIVGPLDVVENILVNLVGNAIKFTEAGSVTIAGDLLENGNELVMQFTITDTGIGIASDIKERIFEPFQQADETVLNRFGGTGLGLTICKQQLEQIGGDINFESNVGVGTTFTVNIPVEYSSVHETGIARASHTAQSATKVIALGDFDADLLAKTQVAGDYQVQKLHISNVTNAIEILKHLTIDDCKILMLDSRIALKIGYFDPIWSTLAKAQISKILVDYEPKSRGNEIHRRNAFATVIPKAPTLEIVRSALYVGLLFAQETVDANHAEGIDATNAVRHVLVADDNRTNRNILAAILENAGHRVTTVCDGDETVEALKAGGFDIVLLDVNMPRLNGIDACKMWRQIEGDKNHIPIVGVTADATLETEQSCLNAGMDIRLTKPVNAERILSTVKSLCSKTGSDIMETSLCNDDVPPADVYAGHAVDDGEMIIDTAHFEYLRGIGDETFIREMVTSFFADAQDSIANLSKAVATNDTEYFRFAAHGMKGCSNNIGAAKLASMCDMLENISYEQFDQQGSAHLDAVLAALTVVQSRLASMVGLDMAFKPPIADAA
jgi:two-component system, sensor histidine kinase RpfC